MPLPVTARGSFTAIPAGTFKHGSRPLLFYIPPRTAEMVYVNKFALAANLKQKTAQGRGQELYIRVQFLLRVLFAQNPLT